MDDGLSSLKGEMFLNKADSSDMEIADLHTVLMWSLRVRALSKTIPRCLAEKVGSTLTLPIWMGVSRVDLGNLEWMGRNSVLLSFSLSEFRCIQSRISAMHASRLEWEVLYWVGSVGLSLTRYSWELSA